MVRMVAVLSLSRRSDLAFANRGHPDCAIFRGHAWSGMEKQNKNSERDGVSHFGFLGFGLATD
jgi:hypothetical protein